MFDVQFYPSETQQTIGLLQCGVPFATVVLVLAEGLVVVAFDEVVVVLFDGVVVELGIVAEVVGGADGGVVEGAVVVLFDGEVVFKVVEEFVDVVELSVPFDQRILQFKNPQVSYEID